MTSMKSTSFKIKKHADRQFYWVILSAGSQVLARGPKPGKYYQSHARTKTSIATLKNGAAGWPIID